MSGFIKALTLALCFALSTSVAIAAEQDVYSFNFTASYMDRHPVAINALLPWVKEVNEKSNGRIKINFFNTGTLCPEPDHLDATRKGQISIGHNLTGRVQGRLPVSVVMDIPNLMTNSYAASEAYWRMYSETPEIQNEYKDLHMLAMHSSAPNQLSMKGSSIKRLAEFKGKKIISTGGESNRLVRELGASGIVMPITDFYLSIARNMANGCLLPIPPIRAMRISEAIDNITICNMRMECFWMAINKSQYDAMPADLRKILDDCSGEKLVMSIAKALDDSNTNDRKTLEKDGINIYYLPETERQLWINKSTPVMKDFWFKQMVSRGYKKERAQEIYDRAQVIFKESQAKWAHKG